MATHLTFNSSTYLWTRTSTGIISYPHTTVEGPDGPWLVEALNVPFDPIHETGGYFWELKEGPHPGYLVSASSNSLGYGNITITSDAGDFIPPTDYTPPTINPLANWRILIKAMGGATGAGGVNMLTFNAPTKIWSRTKTGIISYEYDLANNPLPSSGTYQVNPVTVPYDPVYKTGGSFWELKSGPNVGWLVSDWSNSLGYGNITVTQTAGFDRGPGATIATIYRPEAHLAGFSLNYNAPGELHFTLLVDDPNINVPSPKRTHATVEFEQTPGSGIWVEVWAGWIWDMDATETEVVFYGIDYLAAFKYITDERFPASGNVDTPVDKGGSMYAKMSIKAIISEQLTYAVGLPDSVVGFIKIGTIDSALTAYQITKIYSTFRQTLDFVVGLINSYRAGSGKYTRIEVVKDGTGYTLQILSNPGQARDTMILQYGQLVQGYRVIPFGTTWASRVNLIGQDKSGLRVTYQAVHGAALENDWGRISQGASIVQTQDTNDLLRRANQAAVDAAALGRQIAVGLKLGSFRPLEGFDICDWLPVDIDHGAVHTQKWGNDVFGAELVDGSGTPISSGYWTITGITWESYDDGHWITGLSLWPKNAVPYNPGGVEPDYGDLAGRGGAGVWAAEITGITATPAFVTHALNRETATSSITLPVSPTLDTTRGFLAIVGVSRTNQLVYGQAPPTGWTRDFDDEMGNNTGLYVMHQIFDPVTNPLPATLNPTVLFPTTYGDPSYSSGIMVGFYVDSPGTPIAIRQTFALGITLPGGGVGGANGPFVFGLAPVSNSLLLAFATTGYYWGATGPSRQAHYSPGHLPKENLYTHWGWHDIGVGGWDDLGGGRLVDHSEYGSGTYLDNDGIGLTCEYRIPYTNPEDLVQQATAFGNGPPDSNTSPANVYTDLTTGIQYQYDWALGTWTAIPGTGNTASGLYDFAFSVAATTWVVNHTLNSYPEVTIIDSTGAVIRASIVYNSLSQITITFSSAVAGRVHLG